MTTRSVSRYETNLIIIDNCFSIASRDICPNASCEKFLNYCITDTIVSVLNNNCGEMNHIHNVPKLQHMTIVPIIHHVHIVLELIKHMFSLIASRNYTS